MINPTVGRIVWFYPEQEDLEAGFVWDYVQPCAATVVHVTDPQTINLHVLDHTGQAWAFEEVLLFQDVRPTRFRHRCAEWMPYQKNQQAKQEALDAKLIPKPWAPIC
jgi:hypothetical protein